jgi:DNA adenine methylase
LIPNIIVVARVSETWQITCSIAPVMPPSERLGQGFPEEQYGILSPSMRRSARDVIKINLGRKVKELRLSSKMSQADLADEAKTRRALISEIERGEANPTLDSIVSIATALGVDLADLFETRR